MINGLHTQRMAIIKIITGTDKDVDKLEPLFTADRTIE